MTAPHPNGTDSTAALIAEVFCGFGRLLRGEIALAQAEIKQSVRFAARGLVLMAVAVVFGITATQVLAGACVAAFVALGFAPWGAALLTGSVLVLTAYGFVHWGLRELSRVHDTPARSLFNLGRDVAALKSMVKSDANG